MAYFLLDANVLVAYYTKENEDIKRRVVQLLALKAKRRAFLYVPNFCVVEILGAFAKKCFQECAYGTGSAARSAFDDLRKVFLEDITKSKIFYSYELSRRHILKTDSIYEEIARMSFRRGNPPSAFDVLIIAMGLDLQMIHGAKNFSVLTAERPLYDVYCDNRDSLPRVIHLGENNIPDDLI